MNGPFLRASNDNWKACACGSELHIISSAGSVCSVCEAPYHDEAPAVPPPMAYGRAGVGSRRPAAALVILAVLSGCQSASPPRPAYTQPVSWSPPANSSPPPQRRELPAPAKLPEPDAKADPDGGFDYAGVGLGLAATAGASWWLKRRAAQGAGDAPPVPVPNARPVPSPVAPAPVAQAGPIASGEAGAGAAATEGRGLLAALGRVWRNPVTRAVTTGEGVAAGAEGAAALGVARRFIVPLVGGVILYELMKE